MVSHDTIRRAATDDTQAIRDVARESWYAAYGDFMAEEVLDELLVEGYAHEVLSAAVDADDVGLFVAERDGEVIGYASSESPVDGDIGRVSVYVDPEYWGDDVGTTLFDRACEFLRTHGATIVEDTVLAANDVGVAFYDEHLERERETTVEMGDEVFEAYVFRAELT